MYLSSEHHISRYVPYKKLLRDENDNPVGILPQAFKMREEKKEKALSVNWLEFFGNNHTNNIVNVIKNFRISRDSKVGKYSAFGIANVGQLQETCKKHGHTKVRVLFDKKQNSSNNQSHATIIRLPINELAVMQSLASVVFTELVPNKDIL
jgi:hypothetical protein